MQFVQKRVSNPRIRIELGAPLTGAEPGRAHFHRDDATLAFNADALLIAAGRLPDNCVEDEPSVIGLHAITIGEARQVRGICDVGHNAYWALSEITHSLNVTGEQLRTLAF